MFSLSYAESIATRNTVIASIKDMVADTQKAKPAITININGDDGETKYYTTGDRIEGEVSIVAPTDTRFDEIYISFEG